MIRILLTFYFLVFSLTCLISQEDCFIKNLSVIASPCHSDKKFSVKINFDYHNVGNQGFKISGNGKLYGIFQYSTLPIVIEGLDANCLTNYEFVVRDLAKTNCFQEVVIGKKCCESNCKVEIINANHTECIEDEIYKVGFDVLRTGTGNLGFDLFANGKSLGFYKYDQLPIKNIVIPGSGYNIDSLVVCENDNEHCCDTLSLYNPCECNIYNISSQNIECSNDKKTYYLRINFSHSKTSDSFYIGGSSHLYGKFNYNQLPVEIGPFEFNQNVGELLIADKNNTFCFGSIEPPKVNECLSCGIKELAYSVSDCNAKGEIYVKLKFKAINPGVKGFSVRGNGILYGSNYQYGQDVYYIGPIKPICDQKYEFVIIDNANPNCKNELNLDEKLCCGACSIHSFKAEPICENLNHPAIKLNFVLDQNSGDSVVVKINNEIVGTYFKGLEPLLIEYPFVNNNFYKISVINKKHPDCFGIFEYKFVCNNSGDCGFKDFFFELSECSQENTFKLSFKFKPGGTHAQKFFAKINDQLFGPLFYGEALYHIGPIKSACEGLRIQLTDAENEQCTMVLEKELDKCCEEDGCKIEPKQVESICFEGKIIGLKLVVNGPIGGGYKLFMDNKEIGLYKYTPIPTLINITPRPEGPSVFKIVDIADGNCFKILETLLNCHNCFVDDIVVKAIDCTGNKFKFSINFNTINAFSDSFIVIVNDKKLGNYHVNDLPAISPFFEKKEGQIYTVKIFDAASELCRETIEIKEINCVNSVTTEAQESFNVYYNGQQIIINQNFELQDLYVEIFDLDGKILFHDTLREARNYQVDLNAKTGIYLVSIKTDNERMVKKIFID